MICEKEKVATVIRQNGCSSAKTKSGPLGLLKYDRRLELLRPEFHKQKVWMHNKLSSKSQLSRDPPVVWGFFWKVE